MADAPDYDAGLLNDWGGGNIEWWQDYIRAEIDRANEHWRGIHQAALDREAAKDAELAQWKGIAWTLRSYATHDDDCKVNKPPHYRDCSCGLQGIITDMDELHRAAAIQEPTP